MITSHLFLLDSIASCINYPYYVWPRYPVPSPRHSFSLLLAKQLSKTHSPFRLICPLEQALRCSLFAFSSALDDLRVTAGWMYEQFTALRFAFCLRFVEVSSSCSFGFILEHPVLSDFGFCQLFAVHSVLAFKTHLPACHDLDGTVKDDSVSRAR